MVFLLYVSLCVLNCSVGRIWCGDVYAEAGVRIRTVGTTRKIRGTQVYMIAWVSDGTS